LQDKAEDAGGLTPVKDDNEIMRFPDCRTFLSIFGNCSRTCIHKRKCRMGEGFSLETRRFD